MYFLCTYFLNILHVFLSSFALRNFSRTKLLSESGELSSVSCYVEAIALYHRDSYQGNIRDLNFM